LLIFDGLEPLQYPPRPPMYGKLKDDGIIQLLKGLATTSLGLCVVGMPSPTCAPTGRPPRPCTSYRVSRRPPG
jgi:hypothetical protein